MYLLCNKARLSSAFYSEDYDFRKAIYTQEYLNRFLLLLRYSVNNFNQNQI